jgi:hypothetical protein
MSFVIHRFAHLSNTQRKLLKASASNIDDFVELCSTILDNRMVKDEWAELFILLQPSSTTAVANSNVDATANPTTTTPAQQSTAKDSETTGSTKVGSFTCRSELNTVTTHLNEIELALQTLKAANLISSDAVRSKAIELLSELKDNVTRFKVGDETTFVMAVGNCEDLYDLKTDGATKAVLDAVMRQSSIEDVALCVKRTKPKS